MQRLVLLAGQGGIERTSVQTGGRRHIRNDGDFQVLHGFPDAPRLFAVRIVVGLYTRITY